MTSNRALIHDLNVFFYNAGYFMMPNGNGIVSAPMSLANIDVFLTALGDTLAAADEDGWIRA
jgi:hypothetical protein